MGRLSSSKEAEVLKSLQLGESEYDFKYGMFSWYRESAS